MFRRSRRSAPADAQYITEDQVTAHEAQDLALSGAVEDAEHRLKLIRHLVALRRRARLSQVEVARRMGTTQSAISALEGGEHDPYLSTLQRYARAVEAKVELQVHGPSWEPQDHGYTVVRATAAASTSRASGLVDDLVGSWAPRIGTTTVHRAGVELCS